MASRLSGDFPLPISCTRLPPYGLTSPSAYFGQAGFYILHDPAGDKGIPSGKYDVPLALAAKQYKANGDLFSPAGEETSLYGDVIHVNGQPWPYFKVEPRKYRFRFLDTSISRAFKLYFEADNKAGTQLPFQVVASDAGLTSKPVTSTTLEISMAERWEIVFDFAAFANKNITLRNSRDVQADEDYAGTDRVMRFVVGMWLTIPPYSLPMSLKYCNHDPEFCSQCSVFMAERLQGSVSADNAFRYR